MSRTLPHLAFHTSHDVARLPWIDDEHARAFTAFGRISGGGNGEGNPGFVAVGDELLAAIEHIVVALTARRSAEGGGVGTGLGFGEQAGGDQLAGNHAGQVLLLLLFGAETVQHVGHAVVDMEDGRKAGIGCGEFFDAQAVFRERHARTA
ncbi:hypothetical protein D3C80_1312620 [compost metagenome]